MEDLNIPTYHSGGVVFCAACDSGVPSFINGRSASEKERRDARLIIHDSECEYNGLVFNDYNTLDDDRNLTTTYIIDR